MNYCKYYSYVNCNQMTSHCPLNIDTGKNMTTSWHTYCGILQWYSSCQLSTSSSMAKQPIYNNRPASAPTTSTTPTPTPKPTYATASPHNNTLHISIIYPTGPTANKPFVLPQTRYCYWLFIYCWTIIYIYIYFFFFFFCWYGRRSRQD